MVRKKVAAKRASAAKPAKPALAAKRPGERNLRPHEILMAPTVLNAAGVAAWGKFAGEADLGKLVENMQEQVKKVQDGNLQSVEAMLYGQAMTLQTIFTNLARRAANQEYLKQFETHLSLALKAQAQCRSTLVALAEIKNPRPVSFVQQANIAHGPQQVNNAAKPEQYAQAHAHAEKTETEQNKLLEAQNGNTLDTGAQSTPGRADRKLEAVGTRHRAAHP